MDKDKITNLIWVLVLVPVVFSIFGAIREAGLQGSPYWPLQTLKYFVFLALLTGVPVLVEKVLRK